MYFGIRLRKKAGLSFDKVQLYWKYCIHERKTFFPKKKNGTGQLVGQGRAYKKLPAVGAERFDVLCGIQYVVYRRRHV